MSPPGDVYNYSNLGYLVIGAIIERVTGERFEDVVTSRVLVPAGLTTASFAPDPAHDVPGFPVPGSAPAAGSPGRARRR